MKNFNQNSGFFSHRQNRNNNNLFESIGSRRGIAEMKLMENTGGTGIPDGKSTGFVGMDNFNDENEI